MAIQNLDLDVEVSEITIKSSLESFLNYSKVEIIDFQDRKQLPLC